MAFELERAETIYQRMQFWFSGICTTITDFAVGSKIRSKLETLSVELEGQSFKFYQALKKAIPVAIYRAFDFNLQPAQYATGSVTLTAPSAVSSNTLIPAGTLVATDPGTTGLDAVTFATTANVYILAGNTSVTAQVQCTKTGTVGNVAAGRITKVASAVTASTCTNATATIGGSERETEDARQLRFQEYISTLSRATPAALKRGAKTTNRLDNDGNVIESVTDAVIEETYIQNTTQPAGIVNIYIYNGTGGTTDALVAAAQQIIDGYIDVDGTIVPGYKAAGVVCTVIKATESVVSVTAAITLRNGYNSASIINQASAAITNYISSLGVGKKLVHAELVERIMGIPGVYNVAISTPTADMTPSVNQVYIPGTITVTAS